MQSLAPTICVQWINEVIICNTKLTWDEWKWKVGMEEKIIWIPFILIQSKKVSFTSYYQLSQSPQFWSLTFQIVCIEIVIVFVCFKKICKISSICRLICFEFQKFCLWLCNNWSPKDLCSIVILNSMCLKIHCFSNLEKSLLYTLWSVQGDENIIT